MIEQQQDADLHDEMERLCARVDADGVKFLLALFVDLHGKPCAKMIPKRALGTVLREGAGFAGFAVGDMGQNPSSPDLMAVPDPATYTRLPWKPEVAVLHCDPHVNGEPWPYAPRVILKNLLAKVKARGWTFKTGIEAEYILVRRTEAGGIEIADPLDRSDKPCYEAKGLTRMWDHLAEIADYLDELGWGNYANDHEDALGQFEQNFDFEEALVTADRTIFFRYMVHMVAHSRGMTATFMPKPFQELTGNGLHVHMSLWDEAGTPIFESDADSRGLDLSPLGYQFLAGLLEHGRSMSSLIAPTVNSYKRLGVTAPTSGATWAPGYITYGGNNRTVMLRGPGGRIEHRGVCGSANPYIAFAALLAAGLDGIDRELEPGEPISDNLFDWTDAEIDEKGITRFPGTLLDAVRELPGSEVLREAFGKVPTGDFVDYYCQVKEAEFREYHAAVGRWELDHYLTLF